MSDYKTLSLAYLRDVLSTLGITGTELARRAKVSQTTVTRPLSPKSDHKFAVKFQTLQAISSATGIPIPAALVAAREEGQASAPEELVLPIRYEVAASGFLPRDDLNQRPYGFRRVATIPPYQRNTQWLERVVNDSMDRLIPPGSLIHVVDAIEIEYAPSHGHIVVVERRLGHLVERTVKQIVLTSGGVELWPRSHNPRWSRAIFSEANHKDEEGAEIAIIGLVLRSYQQFTEEEEPEPAF